MALSPGVCGELDQKTFEELPTTPVSSSTDDDTEVEEASFRGTDDSWKFLDHCQLDAGCGGTDGIQRDSSNGAEFSRDDGDHSGTAHFENAVDLAVLRRKVDWRVVPLLFCCYTLQFLDKVLLNYAAVMGMKKDLHLRGNEYSNIATFLFVGLLCFEIPNIYFLQRVPAAKWLGANVTLWGVATACGAASHNYHTLLVSRIFLGIFEATIGPSLILISSQWYTKSEQAPRFSLWYTGLGIGQIAGGAISYAFQQIQTPESFLVGWRMMFLILGIVTTLVGIATILLLPDTPMRATWLTGMEKAALLKHVGSNQTGIESQKFRPREILEALSDPQLYLITIAVILLSVSSGVVTSYSSTLIRNLGYDTEKAALMNMPSGVVSIIFTLLVGFGVRKHSHRWAWIITCIIPAMLGGALMSFLPTSNGVGILVGIYLVNAVVAPLAVFYNLVAANVAGGTKRAFCAAVVGGSFSIGNIIGPQTFRAKDAPDYHPAKVVVLATQAGCAATTFLLFLYYFWSNRRRVSAIKGAHKQGEEEEGSFALGVWDVMTDRENKSFRYTY